MLSFGVMYPSSNLLIGRERTFRRSREREGGAIPGGQKSPPLIAGIAGTRKHSTISYLWNLSRDLVFAEDRGVLFENVTQYGSTDSPALQA